MTRWQEPKPLLSLSTLELCTKHVIPCVQMNFNKLYYYRGFTAAIWHYPTLYDIKPPSLTFLWCVWPCPPSPPRWLPWQQLVKTSALPYTCILHHILVFILTCVRYFKYDENRTQVTFLSLECKYNYKQWMMLPSILVMGEYRLASTFLGNWPSCNNVMALWNF